MRIKSVFRLDWLVSTGLARYQGNITHKPHVYNTTQKTKDLFIQTPHTCKINAYKTWWGRLMARASYGNTSIKKLTVTRFVIRNWFIRRNLVFWDWRNFWDNNGESYFEITKQIFWHKSFIKNSVETSMKSKTIFYWNIADHQLKTFEILRIFFILRFSFQDSNF